MARNPLVAFLLRTAHPDGGVADAELLRRYADGGDEAAFELLVRRHADAVWRVCRGVSRQAADAEDAFQATFLALARKPGSVRGATAAGWLHRVAVRVATKARAKAPRGLPLPDNVPAPVVAAPPDVAAVHEELARLPDRYRLPVVLCDLEGQTHAEAAAQLGWPVGTVSGRLSRARDQLRDRLIRRGVGLPAGGVAALLTGADAGAVSRTLMVVAAGYGSGAGVPGPAVARLATGALLAMRAAQMKAIFVPVAAMAVAVGGVAWSVGQTPQPAPKPAATEPAKPVAATVGVEESLTKPPDSFDRRRYVERLRQVPFAMQEFADDHEKAYPTDIRDKAGKPLLSWRVAILPYLDNEFLYGQIRLDEPWDSDHNKKFLQHEPKVYRTPGVAAGETRVQRFYGPGAAFDPAGPVKYDDFEDGTSNTALVVEAGPAVPWTKPADLAYDPKGPLPSLEGPFTDGFVWAMADGSTFWQRRGFTDEWLRAVIGRSDLKILVFPDPALKPQPLAPLTDREVKRVEFFRKGFDTYQAHARKTADERFRLETEVRKLGPVPLREYSTEGPYESFQNTDTEGRYERFENAYQNLNKVGVGDRLEADRLWKVLEKRDPETAARLRKELEPPKPAEKK